MERQSTSGSLKSLFFVQKWKGVICCTALVLLTPGGIVLLSKLSPAKGNALSAFLGICFGLLPAALHSPNIHATESLQLWVRKVAMSLIVAITLYVALYPWHCFPGPEICPERFYKQEIILVSCLAIAPVAIACVGAQHRKSIYACDAKWCVVGLWALTILYAVYFILKTFKDEVGVQVWMKFVLLWALTLEGVCMSWVVCMFCSRIKLLGLLSQGKLDTGVFIMSAAYLGNILLIVLKDFCKTHALSFETAVIWVGLVLRGLFIFLFVTFTIVLMCVLKSGINALTNEANRVKGHLRLECRWARRVLCVEVCACFMSGLSTFTFWILIEIIRGLELMHVADFEDLKTRVLSPLDSIAHRADIFINAASMGIFSGLLCQIPAPAEVKCRIKTRKCTRSGSLMDFLKTPQKKRFSDKVEEIASRGVTLRAVIGFLKSLSEGAMPSFDPWRSTTNDVVRCAVIPLSRDSGPSGGGSALATLWNAGAAVYPVRMVTHNWSNKFLHLVAAVTAEAMDVDTYDSLAERLATPAGLDDVVRDLERQNALDTTFWICAFSINQHASICSGFGPAPPEHTPDFAVWERSTRNTVTRSRYPVCNCTEPKIFNDQADMCELNKFDDVMRLLHERNGTAFSHVIVVDENLEVFYRAWCVAEMVEGHNLEIRGAVKILSEEALDLHYDTLSILDVQDCQASRVEDKQMILDRITEMSVFNLHLQDLIFGTSGFFSKWIDGHEQARHIGRIVQRAWIPYARVSESCCWRMKHVESMSTSDSDSDLEDSDIGRSESQSSLSSGRSIHSFCL
eukprot:TRINITY_DN63711_c0_g1_i1.p1 TRINITY_DN63711_c0_g1~~TRINITY_DN63711_c0_g1_i1.p1  ORF type:complete len:797 (+),score=83.33 TRINITY_DN63711_c0_g1_i1:44-2434(+)